MDMLVDYGKNSNSTFCDIAYLFVLFILTVFILIHISSNK